MSTMHAVNEEMKAIWDGPEGEHWTAYAEHYERVPQRHWRHLLDTVDLARDASVLDVGCGTGGSTRSLARVATDGSVLGIDLSSRMLQYAADRALQDGLTNVRFERGDAQVYPFDPHGHDAVVSLFGAMFFADPVAAFANIHSALKPGATLALLVWRELSRNDWLVSLRSALALGRELPEPPVSQPGPFGLADQEQVRRVLTSSGFNAVRLEELELPMHFGRDVEEAYMFMSAMGMTKGLTHDLDDLSQQQALGNLRDLVAARETTEGVQFGSSAWLVTATA